MGERMIFSTNDTETTGYPYANVMNWTLQYTQKLFQNGPTTEIHLETQVCI